MKLLRRHFAGILLITLFMSGTALAVDSAVQSKIDAIKATVTEWGKSPALVAAVKECNANPGDASRNMTQAAWEGLTILDPKVRAFQTNKTAEYLKSNKQPWLIEAFVSCADGSKAGFLQKTSNWSHKGKPKHDKPMAGETWQGEVEYDQSAGREAIQIAVPVLDGTTPIGSLVVGLDINKL